jgi:hypothetical protein
MRGESESGPQKGAALFLLEITRKAYWQEEKSVKKERDE